MNDDVCPKSMRFGPCGGVRADLSCEVDQRPCPFVHDRFSSLPPGSRPQTLLALPHPLVIVDVRAPSAWTGDVRRLWQQTGRALQGCVALLGEHVDNPPTQDDSGALDPAVVVEILGSFDVPVLVTVTGRDRDLDDARHLIEKYRAAGAAAIHCVTGDHPAAMGFVRPASFRCESVSIVGEAVHANITATVGESPASPGDRLGRLLLKERTGASVCILNHLGSSADMIEFAAQCRAEGLRMPLVAPVPMIGDAASAQALARFPGLRLPPGFVQRIVTALDPPAEARTAAISLASELARSGHFAGVNLSGSTGATDPWERVRVAGELARSIREAWG